MADDVSFTSLASQVQLLSITLQDFMKALKRKYLVLKYSQYQIRKKSQTILGERVQLDTIIEKRNTLADRLDQTNVILPIKLNVGGTIFCTSLGTLTSIFSKGSYFEAMFSGRRNLEVGDNEEIFIDRDPTVFRYILNFMRGDMPNIGMLSVSDCNDVAKEAQFYCLTGLIDYIKRDSKNITVKNEAIIASSAPSPLKPTSNSYFCPGPNYIVEKNGKEATAICSLRDEASQSGCTILGPWPMQQSLTNFRIVVTAASRIAIGLTPQDIDQIKVPQLQNGILFYCKNQRVYIGTKDSIYKLDGECQPRLLNGAIVGVKVEDNNVSFLVNGCAIGSSYPVPADNYRLCVLMYQSGDKVELL